VERALISVEHQTDSVGILIAYFNYKHNHLGRFTQLFTEVLVIFTTFGEQFAAALRRPCH
jgi:hypothetical protein